MFEFLMKRTNIQITNTNINKELCLWIVDCNIFDVKIIVNHQKKKVFLKSGENRFNWKGIGRKIDFDRWSALNSKLLIAPNYLTYSFTIELQQSLALNERWIPNKDITLF